MEECAHHPDYESWTPDVEQYTMTTILSCVGQALLLYTN